jgi:transglutaminase-like putative cysteine protease
MSWRLAVRHRTRYPYVGPVRASYHEARLTPPSIDGQRTLQAALAITPAARPLRYVDHWGTTVDAFDIHVPHTELVVLATSTVETASPRLVPAGIGLDRPGRSRGPGTLRRASPPVALRPGGGGARRGGAIPAQRFDAGGCPPR